MNTMQWQGYRVRTTCDLPERYEIEIADQRKGILPTRKNICDTNWWPTVRHEMATSDLRTCMKIQGQEPMTLFWRMVYKLEIPV